MQKSIKTHASHFDMYYLTLQGILTPEQIESGMDPIYFLWRDIQDIIGPASQLAHLIRRLFWTKNLNHFNRSIVAALVFVDGVFMEWADLMGVITDADARREFHGQF